MNLTAVVKFYLPRLHKGRPESRPDACLLLLAGGRKSAGTVELSLKQQLDRVLAVEFS